MYTLSLKLGFVKSILLQLVLLTYLDMPFKKALFLRLGLLLFFPILVLLSSCEKDETPKANQPPETKISLHTINREGENRLPSTVTLKWSGSDGDGYVKGYEISFDGKNWHYTTSTDSTFEFRITEQSQFEDIDFSVRAIDNEGKKDPEPANLTVPIKNTPPEARFNSTELPGDTAYTVFPLSWNVEDPDGQETIDSLFIRINQGEWKAIDAGIRFTSLVPAEPRKNSGTQEAALYRGIQPEAISGNIDGLKLNATNRFYLKVKDIAGASSSVDTASFYVKRQSSDLLVLGATSASPKPGRVFKPKIQDVYGNFDFINYFANNQANLPQFWNSVFRFHIALYDKVFIYSDASEINGELVLESASSAIQQFLNNEGKLLVSTAFPDDMRSNSNIFSYSPMDRLANSEGQARIPPDSLLVPSSAGQSFDTLQSGKFIVGADPFYPKSSAEVLFKAQLAKLNGWEGPNNVIASTSNGGNVNQVFSSVQLEIMNERKTNLKAFFNQVLNEKFNW